MCSNTVSKMNTLQYAYFQSLNLTKTASGKIRCFLIWVDKLYICLIKLLLHTKVKVIEESLFYTKIEYDVFSFTAGVGKKFLMYDYCK